MTEAARHPLGLVPDLPAEDYHVSPGVSVSRLKTQADCPAKTWVEKEETAAMARGTLTHTAVFEPHLLDALYTVNDMNRNSNAYKEALAEATAAGRRLVKSAEMETALRMRDAIHAHAIAREAMAPGLLCEQSAYWLDEETGLLCRGRADGIRPEWCAIIDVKTTTNASPRAFARKCGEMRYGWQDAMYRDGFSYVLPWAVEAFIFIAIETTPPFIVQPYELRPEDVAACRAAVRRQLRLHQQYREAGIWPAYSETIETIELPSWATAA